MNIDKVGTVIIKDADGKVIDRFELGMASLLTMREKGAPKILELQKKPIPKSK